MLKTFIMTETDGLRVRHLIMLVDIFDESADFDFEKAAIAAAIEYCNTDEGRKQYCDNCNNFNWGDFSMYVPNEICKNHGFTVVKNYFDIQSFNFDQQLVDDDDIDNLNE